MNVPAGFQVTIWVGSLYGGTRWAVRHSKQEIKAVNLQIVSLTLTPIY